MTTPRGCSPRTRARGRSGRRWHGPSNAGRAGSRSSPSTRRRRASSLAGRRCSCDPPLVWLADGRALVPATPIALETATALPDGVRRARRADPRGRRRSCLRAWGARRRGRGPRGAARRSSIPTGVHDCWLVSATTTVKPTRWCTARCRPCRALEGLVSSVARTSQLRRATARARPAGAGEAVARSTARRRRRRWARRSSPVSHHRSPSRIGTPPARRSPTAVTSRATRSSWCVPLASISTSSLSLRMHGSPPMPRHASCSRCRHATRIPPSRRLADRLVDPAEIVTVDLGP